MAHDGYPSGSVKALVHSTATELYGDYQRWSEVLPAVQEWLEGERGS